MKGMERYIKIDVCGKGFIYRCLWSGVCGLVFMSRRSWGSFLWSGVRWLVFMSRHLWVSYPKLGGMGELG